MYLGMKTEHFIPANGPSSPWPVRKALPPGGRPVERLSVLGGYLSGSAKQEIRPARERHAQNTSEPEVLVSSGRTTGTHEDTAKYKRIMIVRRRKCYCYVRHTSVCTSIAATCETKQRPASLLAGTMRAREVATHVGRDDHVHQINACIPIGRPYECMYLD